MLDEAVAALDRGDVIVLPTETVYGLAARVDRPEAIEKIFDLKGRDASKVLQVLVPGADWLDRLALCSEGARRVARAFWPGSLTLIVPAKDDVPDILTKDGGIGIRVPDHPLALEILTRTGPVAASSANRSGQDTPARIDEIREIFGSAVAEYVDGGTIVGTGSTVVDMTKDEPALIRGGPVSFEGVTGVAHGSI